MPHLAHLAGSLLLISLAAAAIAQEYHNFWTQAAGGVTWLHGAWNADGFSNTYDLPVLLHRGAAVPGPGVDHGLRQRRRFLRDHLRSFRGGRLDSNSRDANRWYTERTTWTGIKAMFSR